MSTWDVLAALEVQIDEYSIESYSREVRPGWARITNTSGRTSGLRRWRAYDRRLIVPMLPP